MFNGELPKPSIILARAKLFFLHSPFVNEYMKPNLLLALAVAVLAMISAAHYFSRWRKARNHSPIKLLRKDSQAALRRVRVWRWF